MYRGSSTLPKIWIPCLTLVRHKAMRMTRITLEYLEWNNSFEVFAYRTYGRSLEGRHSWIRIGEWRAELGRRHSTPRLQPMGF